MQIYRVFYTLQFVNVRSYRFYSADKRHYISLLKKTDKTNQTQRLPCLTDKGMYGMYLKNIGVSSGVQEQQC